MSTSASSTTASQADRAVRARGLMPALIGALCVLCLAEAAAIFPARFCDFRAFYCSGRAVLVNKDPYREQPLHACEHSLPGPYVSDLPAEITIPAPYPGDVLALFAVFARLPFNIAIGVWTLASVAALVAAIAIVARMTSTPLAATAIVVGFPAAVVPLPLGQPTLFVLLALAGSAALLRAGRPRGAALAALVTLIDPHAGLPLCIALFAGISRARFTLLAGIGALVAVELLLFGPAREVEYLSDVLPLHALVNVPEFSQFSTANLIYTAGIRAATALTIGNVWYVASAAVGIICALRLRRTLGMPALVFVPIPFAVFGGSHTHLQQLALAVPALLLMTSVSTGKWRVALVSLTFTAAIPWLISGASPPQFLAIGVLAVAFSRVMGTPCAGAWLCAASLLMLGGVLAAIVLAHGSYVAIAPPADGNALAEVAWGRYVLASSVPPQAWYLVGKIPTLIAFSSALALLVKSAFSGEARRLARAAACTPGMPGYAA